MPPRHQNQTLQSVSYVGCMCLTVGAELCLSSVLSASMTCFTWCGHTGQSLVPVLFRGLSQASRGFACGLSVTTGVTLIGRVLSLHSQLKSWLQLELHWYVGLSPPFSRAGITLEWRWSLRGLLAGCGREKSLWTNACQGRWVRWDMYTGEYEGQAHDASKIDGEC